MVGIKQQLLSLRNKITSRKCVTTLKKSLIVLIFFSVLYYLILYKRPVRRSASWEPMAGVILNKRGDEAPNGQVLETNGVPMIIHQTWKTTEIPHLFGKWMKSWTKVNTDWEYWFWTDEDMNAFMKQKYPSFYSLFESYPNPAYRADAFRYFVLFEYGGVYADLDMEALKPLTAYVERHKCFLSQEPLAHAHFLSPMGVPLVSNALMGCSPGHPFFGDVIRSLPDRAGIYNWNDVLRATGPYMLTGVYRTYTRTFMTSEEGDSLVSLADPEEFHPSFDNSMVDHMRQMCLHSEGHPFLSPEYSKRQKEICPSVIGYDFMSSPAANSYANHHWTHSWAGLRNDPWGVHNRRQTFDVRQLTKIDSFIS